MSFGFRLPITLVKTCIVFGLSALLAPPVCYSDWSQIEPTEESEWVLPLTTAPHQSKSTVSIVVIHYRALAKPCLTHVLHTPFACVVTKVFYFVPLPVHWLWCVWHLCAGVLWFWRGVWGVWSHRRGAQGDFHPNYHSGSLNSLLDPIIICGPKEQSFLSLISLSAIMFIWLFNC